MQKNRVFLMIVVVSVMIIASYAVKMSFAEGYPGLISSPNKKAGQKDKSSGGGIFSFISPTFQAKDKQSQQKQEQQQSDQNPQFQGYESHDSYESYYQAQAEQQQKEQEQRARTMPNVASPLLNNPANSQVQQDENTYTSSVKPVTDEQKRLLSMVNLRTTEGLPKTANIRKIILTTLEMLEKTDISRAKKKELLQEDINRLENLKKGFSLEIQTSDDVYKKYNLPDNYVAQLKQDNRDSLELIEQALNRFYKY